MPDIKKAVAAAALALAFSGSANAGLYDGGSFIVSYDDDFWVGTTFSGSGTSFSFSGVANVAATVGGRASVRTSTYSGSTFPVLSIFAKPSFQLASVLSGAIGTTAVALGPASDAWGSVDSTTASTWIGTSGVVGSSSTYVSLFKSHGSSLGSEGLYDVSDTAVFGSGVDSAALSYTMFGEAIAYRAGSNASLLHDITYFNVTVAAVPEPQAYALLLAGVGLMGFVARRRSRRG